MMSASGNGPTVITIASNAYVKPEETEENGETQMEETTEETGTRPPRKLFRKKARDEASSDADSDEPDAELDNADTNAGAETPDEVTPSQPSFEEKLPDWVRASKPVDDPLQLMLWWIYVGLGLHRTKMQPPKEVSYFRLHSVIESLLAAINFVREETAAIVGVIAIKGGVGKTTVSTWFAATMAWATKLSVAIIDTDRGGGLVASRFGLNKIRMTNGQIKRPLSIYELGKRIEAGEVFTPEKLIAETVSDSKTGVMIFRAPPGQGMGVTRTANMQRHVRSQFAGGLVVDTTPGLRVPMTNATALTSDVKIIVAQGLSDESIKGVRTALNFEPYGLRGSIEDVLVVIVALPLRKCNKRTAYELVDHYNLRPTKVDEGETLVEGEDDDEEDELVEVSASERLQPSQILFVPEDRYMDTHRVEELGPVLFTAARPRTQLALAQLVKAKDDLVLNMKARAEQPDSSSTPEEAPRRDNLTALQQRASA